MNEIDIRDGSSTVDTIRFAPTDPGGSAVLFASKIVYNDERGFIKIVDKTAYPVFIRNEDVGNLIKALQKAVEMGWTK